jgi:pheromone shutdown-related protein TraB
MAGSENKLPSSVSTITVNGKDVYLIGTAHVSKQSVEDVQKTVEMVDPDTICVELCESRYKNIVQRDNWKKMDIFKVIKDKKAAFLLAQLIMSSFYRRLGKQLDVKPGAEMIKGINLAKEREAELVLADRNIEITLKRVWGYLNFWNKLNMASHLFAGLLFTEKIDEKMVEELKNRDQLENILETFAKAFPTVKSRLIDERDIYLSQKIRNAPGKKVVAVVGAGHIPGIVEHIKEDESLDELMKTPPKSLAPIIFAWSIPIVIISVVLARTFMGDSQRTIDSIYVWVLANGLLSAAGALIAFGHPVTIIASFIAAPFTSLNPTIGAGYVSGLVQAFMKKPTVKDLEDLPDAISTVKGFWINPVSRILLVFLFSSLGSAAGTFIAGGFIVGWKGILVIFALSILVFSSALFNKQKE